MHKGDTTMKRIITLILTIAMLAAITACTKPGGTSGSDAANTAQNGSQTDKLPDVVTGSMTFDGIGTVTFELYPNAAPQSALNFIYLAKKGHFNGVIVDRLVKDLCIQAGRYIKGYTERETDPDYTIVGEFSENGIENFLTLTDGAIGWVTYDDNPDSAHTEFAIYPDAKMSWGLEGKVAVFGYITGEESFKVLKKINKRKTYNEKPEKDIVITAVTIDPVTQEGFSPEYVFPEPEMRVIGS